jgi:ABC-type uncharacterized transport system fused permease/ATPase subunit
MLIMFRVLLSSPQRTKLLLLGVAIVAVIGTTAFGQVMLNAWNQPFYNALTRKNSIEFFDQLAVFGVIAGGLLVLNVAQAWLISPQSQVCMPPIEVPSTSFRCFMPILSRSRCCART